METKYISERDSRLMSLRPEVETAADAEKDTERFQNGTIRPILKFQNSILLAQFRRYLLKFKPTFNAYNKSAQIKYIGEVLQQDPRIKNSLIASVVSMMTLQEYEFYCDHKNECNKRIVAMLVQRLQSQLELLY
jgi:hypothetical protein